METNTQRGKSPAISQSTLQWLAVGGAVVAVVVLAAVFRNQWLPAANKLLSSIDKSGKTEEARSHDHAEHDHGHEGHDEGNSLELSRQARKNIGLTTAEIQLRPYVRSVSVPAVVIGRPGRSHITVTALLGGRVTRVYPIEGEAILPGQPLFDLRLTHEELVKAQSELLRSVEQRDVALQEIRRLEAVTASGAVAGKQLLARKYEKQKLDAVLNAQEQSLLLHGLTQDQIDGILKNRKLVQGLTVFAPEHQKNGNNSAPLHPFTLRKLHVKSGEYVDAGSPLCSLMDYSELYIEGRAFEQDAEELVFAAREGWEITATREGNQQKTETINGLKIAYVGNEVDPQSRALYFYVDLPNRIVYESKSADGHRFLTWQYKPGQRMQIQVPVEHWKDKIVLPVDAVAQEGAERYVFQQNGDHFERTPVQVEYQDQSWIVIANDGSVFPGDTVAMSGAHQLQMALKNKAGGGVDPHAGHNH